MIEVEKNFDLKPGDKERLIFGAQFISQKSFTDIYYDNANYALTSKDFWLRKRDDQFEFKVPLNIPGENRYTTDQYRELKSDREISAELGIAITAGLPAALAKAGYKPFAAITTIRERYRKGDFNLDFDAVDDLNYTTFEVELMVRTPGEIPAAETHILGFVKQNGITAPGRGKIIEYLLQHNKEHYQILKASGVIRE